MLLDICCNHLAETISTDNAVEYFTLGYLIRSAWLLKIRALIFFFDYYDEIKEATPDQYKMLILQHPRALKELFEFHRNAHIRVCMLTEMKDRIGMMLN